MKMDIDEAIEWLYDLKHDIIYDEQAEALNMAIDSLGKQKPKKPIIKEWISIDDVVLEYHCPTCGEVLTYSPERCKCEQRIDWSIDWLNADYKKRGERMNIEEAIEHSRQVAVEKKEDCFECAKDHEQLAEWLEELKWYREQDLVTREDVSRKMYWLDVESLVQQIPRVELPVDKDINVPNKEYVPIGEQHTSVWIHGQYLSREAEPPKMRDANIEEIKNTNAYLKTISEPTEIPFEANKPIIVHKKEDWDRFQADINGCKTCKHHKTSDGYCRGCGTTINHYEPYIPKENE